MPATRSRHTPQRSCAVCRTARPQRDLIRLVRLAEGGIAVNDAERRAAGRGAYLCPDAACWQAALQGHALARALRVTLTENDRAMLRRYADRVEHAVTTEGGQAR